ncbi:MAG: hypothetical protein HQ564_00005, partial [Candidatus Saganbacteria bacterium]|nr:hypothetical protein [Candidatus Saganbacteria bacterium]
MQFKLISFGFDVDKLVELPSRDDFLRALDEVARIARLRGRPIATTLIPHRIEHGRVEEVLGEVAPDPNSLGIVFKRVEGGSFKYQGEAAEIESFELAET